MGASDGVASALSALLSAFPARFESRLTAIASDGGPTLDAPRAEDYRIVTPLSVSPWKAAKRPHVGFSWIADGNGPQPATRTRLIRGTVEVTVTCKARTEEEAEQHARYYGLAAQQALDQIEEARTLTAAAGVLFIEAEEPEVGEPLENEHTARDVTVYAQAIIQTTRAAA